MNYSNWNYFYHLSRKHKVSAKAYIWSGIEQVGQQGVRFVLSIVLARMLMPSEYGLMGMLMVFIAVAQAFVSCGLSTGLIYAKEISADDETSVFWLNIAMGALLAGLLCAISPLVAWFYRQPVLKPMLCVTAIGLFIGAFGIVQKTLLTRRVDFRTQTIATMGSIVVGGIVGVIMAWRGLGVWALVGQSLTTSAVGVATLWTMSEWRPRGNFRWTSIQSLWPFSSRFLASGLLNTTFDSLYPLLIGKLYSPADLGFYTRGSSLAMLPASSVTATVGRVALPIFSRLQDDPEKLLQALRRNLRLVAGLYFPAMACLAASAQPLVLILLTDKWAPCVPYLQITAFAGMLYPVHAAQLDVLVAQGRSDLFLRIEIIKKVLIVAVLAVTSPFGVLSMVWGVLLTSVLCLVINGYYTRKLLGYGWMSQALDIGRPAMAAIGIAIGGWGASLVFRMPPIGQLAVQSAVYVLLFATSVISFRGSIYREACELAIRYLIPLQTRQKEVLADAR